MQQLLHDKIIIGWPTGWQDNSNVILLGPKDGGFAPNINMSHQRLENPATAEEYTNEQEKLLDKALGNAGFRVISKGPYAISGVEAYRRTQSYIIPRANIEVVELQVHVVEEMEAVTLTATDKASTFEKNLPVFKAAFAEFKWQENLQRRTGGLNHG